MTQHYRSSAPRRKRRPARLAAAITDEDNFGLEVQNRGIGRVFGVVLLLHLVVVGSIVLYKSISGDEAPESTLGSGDSTGELTERDDLARFGGAGDEGDESEELEDLLPPRRIGTQSVVADHPEMKGHKRYRVGEGEQLIEIVRQFNASVAEVEELNNLKPGDPLYTGQWLTVPDHRGNGVTPVISERSKTVKAKVITDGTEPVKAKAIAVTVDRTPSPVGQGETTQSTTTDANSYTVVRGDTAYAIARRHSVEWKELLRVNGMTDPRQLQAGQVIRIP